MLAGTIKLGAFLLLVAILTVLTACNSKESGQPTKRTLYMAAVEPKGGVTVDKEAFPAASLPAGGGYALTPPNKDGRWEVETYRWDPGSLVVNQGDEVTLEIIGINGSEHPTIIEGYNVSFKVLRGQVTRATFKADKTGIFNIVCGTHRPSMNAQLVVLPR